jgi:AcrR family transcriptional regulator
MPAAVQQADRKTQILWHAAKLFCEAGFAGTSMRDLSRAVGIEPASLYSHIKSKESLLRDICFGVMEAFYSRSDSHVPGMEDCLTPLLQGHVQVILDSPAAAQVAEREWKFLNEEDREKFQSLKLNYEWKFTEAIRTGIRIGQIRDVNPRFAVRHLFASTSWIPGWYAAHSNLNPSELSAQSVKIILEGFWLEAA